MQMARQVLASMIGVLGPTTEREQGVQKRSYLQITHDGTALVKPNRNLFLLLLFVLLR